VVAGSASGFFCAACAGAAISASAMTHAASTARRTAVFETGFSFGASTDAEAMEDFEAECDAGTKRSFAASRWMWRWRRMVATSACPIPNP
jgi:hypothetical protein